MRSSLLEKASSGRKAKRPGTTVVTSANLRTELQILANDTFVRGFTELGARIRTDCHDEMHNLRVGLQRDIRRELADALTKRCNHNPVNPAGALAERGNDYPVNPPSAWAETSNQSLGKPEAPSVLIQEWGPQCSMHNVYSTYDQDKMSGLAPTTTSVIAEAAERVSTERPVLHFGHPGAEVHGIRPDTPNPACLPGELPPLMPVNDAAPGPPDVESQNRSSNQSNMSSNTVFSRQPTRPTVPCSPSLLVAQEATWEESRCRRNTFIKDSDLNWTIEGESPNHVHTGRLSLTMEKARAKKKNKNSGCPRSASELLNSPKFDNLIGFIILLNACSIGVQTDYLARHETEKSPVVFRIISYVFLGIFSMELLVRLYVNGLIGFFFKRGRMYSDGIWWNWFDAFVVGAQVVEEFLNFLDTSGGSSGSFQKLRLLKVLRILRLMRVLRVMRVLRLISELRTIVSSIVGSMKSLGWAILLLLLMIYIVGVFFTQQINQYMVELDPSVAKNDKQIILNQYFGSLLRTILSLFQAMSGGIDWDSLADPLIREIHPALGFAFTAYIAFAILALLNVVTGVFVQTALQSARDEEDAFLTDQIISLFHMRANAELAGLGKSAQTLTSDEVEEVLANQGEAVKEWRAIDLKPEEAKYLFNLLDIERKGEVDFEEFLSGCLRLKGSAKSIDMLAVMQEFRSFVRKYNYQHKTLDERVERIRVSLESMDICMDVCKGVEDVAGRLQREIAVLGDAARVDRQTVTVVNQHMQAMEVFRKDLQEALSSFGFLQQLMNADTSHDKTDSPTKLDMTLDEV